MLSLIWYFKSSHYLYKAGDFIPIL
jgi:hypothetical protein